MTYPDYGDMLAGLDATPEERLAFYRALDEAEAEEDAGWDGDPDPEGPWRDGYSGDELDRLAAIGETLDGTYSANATRIGEDIVAAIERRPKDEARLASAMRRIEAGTYTEPEFFRPRGGGGRFIATCGQADDLGYCQERYHQAGCESAVASAAATSTPEAVRAWNEVVSSGPTALDVIAAEQQLGLASPSTPEPWDGTDTWSDLLHSETGLSDTDLRARVLHSMGETGPLPPEPRPDLPDVTVLRAELGI
jgi:hypothetical protein